MISSFGIVCPTVLPNSVNWILMMRLLAFRFIQSFHLSSDTVVGLVLFSFLLKFVLLVLRFGLAFVSFVRVLIFHPGHVSPASRAWVLAPSSHDPSFIEPDHREVERSECYGRPFLKILISRVTVVFEPAHIHVVLRDESISLDVSAV